MEININLQLFAQGEKTEKPTPKKRKDAREEGQVLQSKEVTAAFILFITFVGLKIFGQHLLQYFSKFMVEKEIAQVKQAGLNCYKYVFFARAGYEEMEIDKVEKIEINALFE